METNLHLSPDNVKGISDSLRRPSSSSTTGKFGESDPSFAVLVLDGIGEEVDPEFLVEDEVEGHVWLIDSTKTNEKRKTRR